LWHNGQKYLEGEDELILVVVDGEQVGLTIGHGSLDAFVAEHALVQVLHVELAAVISRTSQINEKRKSIGGKIPTSYGKTRVGHEAMTAWRTPSLSSSHFSLSTRMFGSYL